MCLLMFMPSNIGDDPSLQSAQVLAQLYRTEQDGKAVSKRKELKISYVFIPVDTQ